MLGLGCIGRLIKYRNNESTNLPTGLVLKKQRVIHFGIEKMFLYEVLLFLIRYAVSEDGPLTSSAGLEAVGFINTKYANQSDDWPDMEFMLSSTSTPSDGGLQVSIVTLLYKVQHYKWRI